MARRIIILLKNIKGDTIDVKGESYIAKNAKGDDDGRRPRFV